MNELSGRCKDCYWWRIVLPHRDDVRGCNALSGIDPNEAIPPDEPAAIYSNPDHIAILVTKPEFGCVQFQTSAPEDDEQLTPYEIAKIEQAEADITDGRYTMYETADELLKDLDIEPKEQPE